MICIFKYQHRISDAVFVAQLAEHDEVRSSKIEGKSVEDTRFEVDDAGSIASHLPVASGPCVPRLTTCLGRNLRIVSGSMPPNKCKHRIIEPLRIHELHEMTRPRNACQFSTRHTTGDNLCHVPKNHRASIPC